MHYKSNPIPRARQSRQVLAARLRRQIVDGHYQPGQRLPTRDELVDHFGASKHTVQSALARLGREGFVTTRARAGTFVVDRPPHLCRFALVFPFRASRSCFYEALRAAAHQVGEHRSIEFVEYVQEAPGDLQRLGRAAREHCLAGAVFVHPIHAMWSSPLLTEPGAPKVLVQSSTTLPIPDLHVDMDAFYERAFELVARRGRRRVAVIFSDVPWAQWSAGDFQRAAQRHGLRLEPYWLAPIGGAAMQETVTFAARALMAMQGERRPDALIVADDNYLTPVVSGLLASGVRLPDDVTLLSHCNYPMPRDVSGLPVAYLGFDCTVLMERAVRILDAQRRGRAIQPAWLQPLPAQTPGDLPPTHRAAQPQACLPSPSPALGG